MKKLLTVISLIVASNLIAATPPVPAQETNKTFLAKTKEITKAKEFSFTLAGTYTVSEPEGLKELFDTNAKDGDYGINLGATAWFSEHIGLGVEAGFFDITDIPDHIFDTTALVLYGCYQVTDKIIPYALVGGGKDWSNGSMYVTTGFGVEYRISKAVGVFLEARYAWAELQRNDKLSAQFGISLNL